jgi:acetyl-CoA carboxylase carboxyl transferase subunit beta
MPLTLPFRPRRESYPPDMWTKCPSCSEMLFNKHLEKNLRVCGTCGHHFRISARTRLDQLLDAGTFRERDEGLVSRDPLGFVDSKPYVDRLVAAQLATGRRDGATWGFGALGGRRVAICALDFGFMGGSMGSVVGEKVTRAAEGALAERVPLIVVSSSGGARMQEGTLALMQLVKTIGALERLRAAGLLYISVLADPTTGGVFASFAALGDVNVAEPNALIGFAGARVSAGTIAEELPPGFQRAEFLFSHGFVDRIVSRADLRDELALLLDLLRPAERARRRVRGCSPWLTGCWAARASARRRPRPRRRRIPATRSGPGCSWPATRAARIPWSWSARSPTRSWSSTVTGCSATTAPSWADRPASTAGG